jgi:hypothetical protein
LLTTLARTGNSREYDLLTKGKIATINGIFDSYQTAVETLNNIIENDNDEEETEEL